MSLTIEQIEVDLLLEALYKRYGYDFRHYGRASIKRRIEHHLAKSSLSTISELIPKILHDSKAFESLFFDISVTVTEMFRDPWVYQTLRQKVIPFLQTFPFINVWHAGCATGEEVYSLAILLQEENLYNRVQIYATDINDMALQKAKSRIYPLEKMKAYSQNYQKAGGKKSLSDYYHAQYHSVIFDSALQKNITFANHNLVTDGVFGEMHLILCRNVLIYFDKSLQERVFQLLQASLCHNGFLCLGSKESLFLSTVKDNFVGVLTNDKIYQYKSPKVAKTGQLS